MAGRHHPPPDGRILLATRNRGKAREIRDVLEPLGLRVVALDELDPEGRIPAPPEDAATFAENARRKAAYYARTTGCWALADDSGLEVDALGGAPGVRSARYAADANEGPGPGGDRASADAANNARLLRELSDVPDDRRAARFVCHLSLSDGRRVVCEADGAVDGRIARRPAGGNGFGYDPLFHLPELGRTAAELPPEQKNAVSHRGRAVRRFARRLRAMLAADKEPPP